MSADPPSLFDPPDESAWQSYRAEAHALLDAMFDRLHAAGEGRVWTPMPDAVKRRVARPAPAGPQEVGKVIDELSELILPYGNGNTHPRYWGWVQGTGTVGGVLAEMVSATMTPNCGGRDHGAIYVERAVIAWAARWFGFPKEAGGVLVTGSSMANILGVAVARFHKADRDVRRQGNGAGLVAYASAEVHASTLKGIDLLGLGRDNLRAIPVDDAFRLRTDELAAAIARDRAAGLTPFCVIATAGTVNTGAFDDLEAIAALCKREGLWFHVDGAFGGLAVLDPSLRDRARGIEKADSVAFDYHKWLHVPYDAGLILVRDAKLQTAVFGGRPDYLADGGGLSGGAPWPTDFGVDLSRGFRALKIWWLVKEHGTRKLGRALARNCAQAVRLAGLLARNPRIELMAPVSLNIVVARYVPAGQDDEALDRLNARIAVAIQESGEAVLSTCRLKGRLCLRVCITNHRTKNADLKLLADAIEREGRRLAGPP